MSVPRTVLRWGTLCTHSVDVPCCCTGSSIITSKRTSIGATAAKWRPLLSTHRSSLTTTARSRGYLYRTAPTFVLFSISVFLAVGALACDLLAVDLLIIDKARPSLAADELLCVRLWGYRCMPFFCLLGLEREFSLPTERRYCRY
jgi:hypothetical protein